MAIVKTRRPRDWSKSKYKHVIAQLQRKLKDGVAFEAVKYADFTCDPASFAGQIHQLARAYDMRATCVTTSQVVVYRFFSPSDYWRPNLAAFAVVKRIRREEG